VVHYNGAECVVKPWVNEIRFMCGEILGLNETGFNDWIILSLNATGFNVWKNLRVECDGVEHVMKPWG
jgi:hypothetical protein